MIRSVAVLGAGVMGAQIAAHVANAGVPALLLDVTAEAAAEGLKRARALKPDPFFTPDTWKLVTTGSFDQGSPSSARPTGSSRPSSSSSTSNESCSRGSIRRDGRDRSSARTRRAFRLPRWRKGAATISGVTGSARTSSTRRATCICSKSFRRRKRSAPSSTR